MVIVIIHNENYGKPGQLTGEAAGSSLEDMEVKAQQSPPGALLFFQRFSTQHLEFALSCNLGSVVRHRPPSTGSASSVAVRFCCLFGLNSNTSHTVQVS